ncbi:hypothetical protein Hanom_Chr16g01420931 [Helianthus anomalus]
MDDGIRLSFSVLPELSDDVKQLSNDDFGFGFSSRLCFKSGHPLSTMETSCDSSAFATSASMTDESYPASVSCAFLKTDCKYLPCASILSCKCLCT